MDDFRQFGFPLLERDIFSQFVFCRTIFCHFSILFSAAKIYNYLNYSILFLVKKLTLPHRNHPKADLLHVLHLKIHLHQINDDP